MFTRHEPSAGAPNGARISFGGCADLRLLAAPGVIGAMLAIGTSAFRSPLPVQPNKVDRI